MLIQTEKIIYLRISATIGLRSIKQWIGLPTSDADVGSLDEDDEPGGNPMKQLQELVAPHRHRPISLDNLANETR